MLDTGTNAPRVSAALVWLLAAVLSSGDAGAAERLPESQISRTFSGMSLDGTYRDGEFFSETYSEDGTIRYHGAESADSGEWSVREGKFCTFYDDQQGACFFVEHEGSNCFFFFAEQETGAPNPPPETDWTSRGWDKSRPSTCPTAPEVQL